MYRYEIKQILGSQRKGIFVDGMLLAKIDDPRMEREAELLVKLGTAYVTGEYLRPPAPMIVVTSEEEKARIESNLSKSEVRSDLCWDA